MRPFLAFTLAALAAASPLSGQVIWSANERIHSVNAAYYVNVKSSAGGVTELQVFDSKDRLLWSTWADWGKDSIAAVSDDGKAVVVIDREYSNLHPLVVVYNPRGQAAYSTKSIIVNPEYLKTEGTRKCWFENIPGNMEFSYDEKGNAVSVELILVSGREISISL